MISWRYFKMMNNDFDPYDALISMNERLHKLERAHNKAVDALRKTDVDLQVALHSLRNLQQQHLKLSQHVHNVNIDQPK